MQNPMEMSLVLLYLNVSTIMIAISKMKILQHAELIEKIVMILSEVQLMNDGQVHRGVFHLLMTVDVQYHQRVQAVYM